MPCIETLPNSRKLSELCSHQNTSGNMNSKIDKPPPQKRRNSRLAKSINSILQKIKPNRMQSQHSAGKWRKLSQSKGDSDKYDMAKDPISSSTPHCMATKITSDCVSKDLLDKAFDTENCKSPSKTSLAEFKDCNGSFYAYDHRLRTTMHSSNLQSKVIRSHLTISSIYSTFGYDEQLDTMSMTSSDGETGNTSGTILPSNGTADKSLFKDVNIHNTNMEAQLDSAKINSQQELNETSVVDLVAQLWSGDPSFCKQAEIAEWLGTHNELRTKALKAYMGYFDFSTQRVDVSFRQLCEKLHFKAESQQMDRIIEAFATRYWECNPDPILRNADVVHAIAYSLLLLNTDLHVAAEFGSRMTRSEFVRNTIATIETMGISGPSRRSASISSNFHSFLASESFPSFISSASIASAWIPSKSLIAKSRHKEINVRQSEPIDAEKKHEDHKPNSDDKAWLTSVQSLLKELYSSIKLCPIQKPSEKETPDKKIQENQRNSERSSDVLSPNSLSKKNVVVCDELMLQHSTLQSPSSADATKPTLVEQAIVFSGSGFLSETHSYTGTISGFFMRKHFKSSTGERAKYRGWQLCYMTIDNGQLCTYRHTIGIPKQRRSSLVMWDQNRSNCLQEHIQLLSGNQGADIGEWRANCKQALDTVKLNHCLAWPLPPPGWNERRKHVFFLKTADGEVFVFETLSISVTIDCVTACNYWAALQSKKSMTGAVCNVDYGWGMSLKDDYARLCIWRNPIPCPVSSTLSETYQLAELEGYIGALSEELQTHRSLKDPINRRFSCQSFNRMKALMNWERKAEYLIHEIMKFQIYHDVLNEKSLQNIRAN